MVEKISSFQPDSILEIGCGYGSNLFWLAKKIPSAKVRGIDINPKEVEIGNEFLTKRNISNVKLLVGKADKLDQFKDKSFDVVLTDAVLMYIGPDKIKKVIKEMARIAKKALILVEWHNINSGKKGQYDPHLGLWKRDYSKLLNNLFPINKINFIKIDKNLWPNEKGN